MKLLPCFISRYGLLLVVSRRTSGVEQRDERRATVDDFSDMVTFLPLPGYR